MSMISELVGKLREFSDDCTAPVTEKRKHSSLYSAYLAEQAADMIEELSAKVARQNMERSSQYYGGGWIPCSERLPEITAIGYGDNKVYSEDMLVALRWYDGDVTIETGWCNRNGTWSNDSKNCKVIAWQPLPPKYEPKED